MNETLKYVNSHNYVGDVMSKNITLSVADDAHARMRAHPDIKWSEVARNAIEERLDLLDALDEIAGKSKLSASDAARLAEKIKRGVAKRHGLVG